MPRFLITGGAGFIGSNLADRLAADSNNFVVAADNLLTGSLSYINQKNNLKFVKADVNVRAQVHKLFRGEGFDYVYHYAAVVGVQRTLRNPTLVLDDIDGIRHVLDCSRDSGVRRVFFSSSSEVYGEPVEMPQHEETTPLNSRLPYAVVKNIGESFLRSYKQAYGLDYTIFRFFNTYGPRQSSDFVMSRFISAALANHDITVYGSGDQTRTFCYIDDNVEATTKAMENSWAKNQVINVGDDREITILDLAKLIIKRAGSSSGIVHLPALKEGDMTRRRPDIAKMKKLLGRELKPLEAGVDKLLEHTRPAA